jgi:hypothetical protein
VPDLALIDEVLDQRRIQHHLHRGHAANAAFTRDKALRYERFGIKRQVHQQLLPAFFREEVNYAIECLVGAVGMQRGQAKVAGFGKLDTVFHGFLVTNLADQNDIWRLAQRVLERHMPGISIHANLPLRNDTPFVRVDVFDRILDRNDMATRIFVTVPDHCRERRRLTGTRATDYDTKAALVHDDVF